jgi:hypothetical protein
LLRATVLRDAAVELVARRGGMIAVKAVNKVVEVMAFEGEQVAVLYKTPNLDLGDPTAPAFVNPKGFLVDVWFGAAKKLSVQWDHDGAPEVLLYKSGDWEIELESEAAADPHVGAAF